MINTEGLRDLLAYHEELRRRRRRMDANWKRLAAHFLPHKCRLEHEAGSKADQGDLRGDKLDSTAFYAMRDLAAGMHGGLTSPARPWFRLEPRDQALARDSAVRNWLDAVTRIMRSIYHQSGFYKAVSEFYAELGTFGTAFMFEVEDADTGVRFIPLTAGEYCLDIDDRGRVDTVFRVISMTLRQLAMRFRLETLPRYMRELYKDRRNHAERWDVIHAVYPRRASATLSRTYEHGDYDSVYILSGVRSGLGASGGAGGSSVSPDGQSYPAVLLEERLDEFPGFGARWDVTGSDTYGRGPASDTLADSVMLQQMTSAVLKALQKEIDPPLAAPSGLENISLLPGAVTPVNDATGKPVVYPILQVRHNIEGTYNVIAQLQNKVREGLFNNLFRMLLNSDRRQITAREVAAREEEKLILIGPVLERLHNEFFIPLTTRTFNLLLRAGRLPEPPDLAAEAGEIDVQLSSVLAVAQKMVATGEVEQFVSFAGNVAQAYPEVLDAIDSDALIDNYADYLGIEGNILRGQDAREELRARRAEQQARAQQAQEALANVQATKDLGSARTDNTALGAILGGMAGAIEGGG